MGTERWIDTLPKQVADTVRVLIAEPILSPEASLEAIAAHEAEVKAHSRSTEFMDLECATAIAEGLRAVIGEWDQWSDQQRETISAAVRYFALVDDAESDVGSVLGFEDDAAVYNAAVQSIGRSDLKVVVG